MSPREVALVATLAEIVGFIDNSGIPGREDGAANITGALATARALIERCETAATPAVVEELIERAAYAARRNPRKLAAVAEAVSRGCETLSAYASDLQREYKTECPSRTTALTLSVGASTAARNLQQATK